MSDIFNLKDFLNSVDHSGDTTTFEADGETFRIKALSGLERDKWTQLESMAEKRIYAIAKCLFDPDGKPVGDELARRLYDECESLAVLISENVYMFSIKRRNIESKAWEEAVKNLQKEEENMKSSSGDTAKDTASTQ